LEGKKCKKFNFFQNQNDTCAHLFTLVMKFHDRQSSERCIRKLISHHCLDKTRTRWNDFLFLITDDRDFRPQTFTNGLVFRECKHIKNIFEDVYFTKNSFHITLNAQYFSFNNNTPIIIKYTTNCKTLRQCFVATKPTCVVIMSERVWCDMIDICIYFMEITCHLKYYHML
jgi:hypothetical protein